jgi:acyl-CoA thioester hydrolase
VTAADPTLTVHDLRVRFCETDLMGIVHHASYLTYFEAGRVEWLRRRGVTYAAWAKRGLHLPVVEVGVKYRLPAFFDDLLRIETRLAQLRTVSLRFEYRLLRIDPEKPGSQEPPDLLAEGFTRLAAIDDSHTLHPFSDEVLAILRAPEK